MTENGSSNKRRIAIACQGGGSHTAFTAGALKRILGTKTLGDQGYEIVGLSGTSGGAICAFLTWYALLENDEEKAVELLESFWIRDNSAYLKVGDFSSIGDVLANGFVVGLNRLKEAGFGVPTVSPYDLPLQSGYYRDRLKRTIEKNLQEGIRERVEESGSNLLLFIGAVDVLTGDFQIFRSHEKTEDGALVFNDSESDRISVEAILASAAIPSIFEAERTGEAVYWSDSRNPHSYVDKGVYWDGLSSQNPPIRDLVDANPDEVWILQINPEEIDEEPRTAAGIEDRRNELTGNLSLNQELFFVRKVNELVRRLGEWEDGTKTLRVPGSDEKEHRITKVRRIELSLSLPASSKLDRSPSFIEELIGRGEERAARFLETIPFQLAFEAAWEEAVRTNEVDGVVDLSAVMDLFVDDAVVRLVLPDGPSRGLPQAEDWEVRGASNIQPWLEWCLRRNFGVEQSRDYDTEGEKLAFWILLSADHFRDEIKGRVELTLRREGGEDKISSFTFYPLSLEAVEELRGAIATAGRDA